MGCCRDMIPMWRRVELQVQPNAHREPLLSVEALRHEHHWPRLRKAFFEGAGASV